MPVKTTTTGPIIKVSPLFDTEGTHLLSLRLPYPPSINNYYGRTRTGRVFIKAHGKQFRQEVGDLIRPMLLKTLDCRIRLWVEMYPPDRRRRDVDNIKKALLDALTHAEVYDDDCLIDDLRVVRGDVVKGGELTIHLFRLD
ncbi:RusA family crossover junction endodeoxyribonuclease [Bacterioplanoides sp.]|uniref:RusA family crossover junction endodeoxyribonuclease n=1 Tax=Bacterioplanoides sp. TaxID=2066072 RepID=UPI003B001705